MARSVVQVQIMANGELQGWGSGTVISDDGLILTNAHVATPSDIDSAQLIIAVTQEADQAPVQCYKAEVVASDSVLDLAIIKISENMGGGPYDGALEPMPSVTRMRSSIGDEIIILGYPSRRRGHDHPDHGHVSGFTANPTLGAMPGSRPMPRSWAATAAAWPPTSPARSSGCPPSWAPATPARSWTAGS